MWCVNILNKFLRHCLRPSLEESQLGVNFFFFFLVSIFKLEYFAVIFHTLQLVS